MKKELLVFEHVGKNINGYQALNDVSLVINEGEIIFLTGLFGCGKEEIGHIIAGESSFDSGRILYEDKEFYPKELFEESDRATQLYSDNIIIPNLTVAENIYLNANCKNMFSVMHKKKLREQAKKLLEEFDLDIDLNSYGWELSVFDQLSVCMLRSYLSGAKIIIVNDIFFLYMDIYTNQLKKTMNRLKSFGMTIIIVSGDLSQATEVDKIIDRFVIMRDGRIVKIMDHGNFSQNTFKYAITTDYPSVRNERARIREENVGFYAEQICSEKLHGLSFTVHCGEALGIFDCADYRVNEELEKILTGRMLPLDGQMNLMGEAYCPLNEKDSIRRGVICYQGANDEKYLFENLSALENIMIPVYKKTSKFGLLINRNVQNGILEELKGSGIEELSGRKLESLDYYEIALKNKVVLYRQFYMNAKLIVMVEPLLCCDQEIKKQVLDNIRLLKERRYSILILSSRVNDLISLCDDFLILENGRVVGAEPAL